jgi:hypothetical protein
MKIMPAHLKKNWRICLAGIIMFGAAMGCTGGTETSVPPQVEPPTEPITEEPIPVEPEEPSVETPEVFTPELTTGTISGVVEFAGLTTEPLADTIVEIAGWENTYWDKTNALGEYIITDVPPGVYFVIPQANTGLTSYQSVNVVPGQVAVADFRVLSASPMVQTGTISVTILVDGAPVSGAYLWLARTNQVYQSDQNGNLSFVYGSANNKPVVVVYNDRWEVLEVPVNVDDWNIELTRGGDPPPLPDGMVLVIERRPIILEALLPTPFTIILQPRSVIQEDCISFQGSKAALERVDGRWKIVVGDIWLLDFGENQQEAKEALKILQYYEFNQQCFVGRPDPTMEYYLNDGKPPTGFLAGEDCIGFNPASITVENVGGRWKITEGSHWLMDFNDQEAEAQNANKIIQKYQFNNFCFVGRPDPSLVYFRK